MGAQPGREASCDVYWARTSSLRLTHLRFLADAEIARHARYHRAEDRDRFALAAVLLRTVVGLHTGVAPAEVSIDRSCPRCREPHGRPRVIGHPVEVSVSHSGEFAGVALTGAGAVGVDVEHVRSFDHAAITSEVFTREENDAVTSLAAFYALWTRKESVLKAAGVGLELPMAKIRVSPPPEPARLLGHTGGAQIPARMADVSPGAGYAGAVTVLTSAPVAFREVAADGLLEAV